MTLSIAKTARKTSIAHGAMSSTCTPAGAKALKPRDHVIVEQALDLKANSWLVRCGVVAKTKDGIATVRFDEGDEHSMPAFVSSARHADFGVQNIRFAS